ncbi:MotE family protein [Tepidimicrobium xylanilyticum]|uniref:Flagellar motility protein MotE, a chaperone for MotC folding n=1 Tax=Tepidimicrobium xylanilyticum TaxID=1123352 RepID=A0A1H2YGU6_9FIRM|nr:hypothetical protein [Tepidimicrobium xylanilyticum]GMG97139.1 hypothetical protein EN5CB1_19650 [Tepidimicrobium xylanilyticum]SDX04397.1 Flagellar motility protein MotE, a chaperone for MotC folding [Tepidimicrobium xylanilyticum]
MENVEVIKNKKGKAKRFIIAILIIIPILVLSLLYFNNKTFKLKVNSLLAKVPGGVGDYFRTTPTELEREDKKVYLADYYLSLDPVNAADKLYIIKKDDEKLYSEIIRLMNSNSPTKTSEIIKNIRNLELRKDLLFSIYDEIQEEKANQFLNEVSRLESQDLLITINEIKNRYEREADFKETLPQMLSQMNEDRLTDILFYIDDSLREELLNKFNIDLRTKLDNKLSTKKFKRNNLMDLAHLYEVKPLEEVLEEIGNSDKYSFEELGTIYKNLSIIKSAEIFSEIEDDSFKEQLFAAIRKEEELVGEENSITNDISRAIQFLTEYNKKIDDLVKLYNRMSPDKAAKVVEKMLANENTVTALEINSEPIYEISDATIIVDVLSRMNNKNLSSIMDNMNTENASKLTQLLAKP